MTAGPDSLESGGFGESEPASLWPEWPGSRGEERRREGVGAEAALLGPDRVCWHQGGHLWTRGSVQAWIKLQDTPQASHQQVKGNLEVSQP